MKFKICNSIPSILLYLICIDVNVALSHELKKREKRPNIKNVYLSKIFILLEFIQIHFFNHRRKNNEYSKSQFDYYWSGT